MARRAVVALILSVVLLGGLGLPAAHAAPQNVTGRVVLAGSLTPVAHADVCVGWTMCAVADANGGFSLTLEEGPATLSIRPATFGTPSLDFIARSLEITVVAGTNALGDIVVEQYGSVSGLVSLPTGGPAAGAVVGAGCAGSSCFGPVAWTGLDGRYTLSRLAPGTHPITVQFQSGQGPVRLAYPATTTAIVVSGQDTPNVDLTMTAGAVISGTVTDASGTAIVGAKVSYKVTAAGPFLDSAGYSATTVAGGLYETLPLPAGATVVLTAGPTPTHAASAPITRVIVGGELIDLDFELADGGWVQGVVTDASTTNPVAGVAVQMSCDVCGPAFFLPPTGADGAFRFPALPEGTTYTLAYGFFGPNVLGNGFVVGAPLAVGGRVENIGLELGGKVAGTLLLPNGTPATNGNFLVCSPTRPSHCIGGGAVGAGGAFSTGSLATGNYLLFFQVGSLRMLHEASVAAPATTTLGLQIPDPAASTSGGAFPNVPIGTDPVVTATNPIATSIVSPVATTVSITEQAGSGGISILGQEVVIETGTDATAENPFVFTFTLDASVLGAIDPLSVEVFRDGVALAACTSSDGSATPDPCLASRTLLGDGDLQLVARTSHASTWTIREVAAASHAAFILSPIDADGSSTFNVKRGVVPVRWRLTTNGTATCTLPAATIRITRLDQADPTVVDEGASYRTTDCAYHASIAARRLGAGRYEVQILIGGATVGAATFAVV